MKASLRVNTSSSPACVHAVESSDDVSPPSRRAAVEPDGEASSPGKKMSTRVTKLLLPPKLRRRITQAFRSLSMGKKKKNTSAPANDDGDGDGGDSDDDGETYVSAKSSELRSTGTDGGGGSEPTSFRLSPLIFPTGSISRPPPPPPSPVKVVRKLPFGYVIGRELDPSAPPPPAPVTTALARRVKKVAPLMAQLHLRARSQMVGKKVARALKDTFRRAGRRGRRRGGADQQDDGCGNNGGDNGDGDACSDGDADGDGEDDEDVFWKKDVRGLRCRRVEDDDEPY
ncbi:hypothetical protein ACP4OV_014962 [Aristida adscensionis]